MMNNYELVCSFCSNIIDIGDSFILTSVLPARSISSDGSRSLESFRNHGDFICHKCILNRIGEEALNRLISIENSSQHRQKTLKKQPKNN